MDEATLSATEIIQISSPLKPIASDLICIKLLRAVNYCILESTQRKKNSSRKRIKPSLDLSIEFESRDRRALSSLGMHITISKTYPRT